MQKNLGTVGPLKQYLNGSLGYQEKIIFYTWSYVPIGNWNFETNMLKHLETCIYIFNKESETFEVLVFVPCNLYWPSLS